MKNKALLKHISPLAGMILLAISAIGQTASPGIYLHHDQPYYISGDDIHYASYLFDRETGKSDRYNRIVKVALLGPVSRYQDQILSTRGTGHGLLHIPDTVKSGFYQLVAYVGRPDHSSDHVFKKYIQILQEEDSRLEICEISPKPAQTESKLSPFAFKTKVSRFQMEKSTFGPREPITLSMMLADASTGSISITKRKRDHDQQLTLREFVPAAQASGQRQQVSDEGINQFDSLRIKGTIFNSETGSLLKKSTVTVSFPSQEEFYVTNTDSEGKIDLVVKKGFDEYIGMFHTFDDKVFHRLRFEPDSLTSNEDFLAYTEPCNETVTIGLSAQWVELIENGIISKAFGQSTGLRPDLDDQDFLEDLFDKEVMLDDYEKLDNMKVVFSGITPNVSMTNNSRRPLKVFPVESSFSYKQLPLFYVDGFPTYDVNWILSLDPDAIASIGVIASSWKLAIFGKAGSSGIVSMKSKDGSLMPPMSPNMFRIQGHSHYESDPVMITPSDDRRSPQFSTLLYWHPEFEAKEGKNQIQLHAGDATGTFDVRFEGFTSSGLPVSFQTTISILSGISER
ncbi:MAG: hypothetical protein AAFO69_09845 [Bacteroidota bacterium]